MVLAVCGALGGAARADEQEDKEARRLYDQGRTAYRKHEFQSAYDAFRQSYLLSQRPELLFNMSSALKALDRPHDAAEELRAYLRLVPAATDRAEIEQRILTLEESQRILERERGARAVDLDRSATTGGASGAPTTTAPAPTTTAPTTTASTTPAPTTPAPTTTEPSTTEPAATATVPTSAPAPAVAATSNPLTAPSPDRPRRRLGLAIGLGVGGAILAGVAIGLGVGLSHGAAPAPTSATFGTIRATP